MHGSHWENSSVSLSLDYDAFLTRHVCAFLVKNMEVNRSGGGDQASVRNEQGIEWWLELMPEMARRLDKIVEEVLQGSGFAFMDDGI